MGSSVIDFEARERLAEALQPLVENDGMRGYARSLQLSSNTVKKWLDCESFPSGKNLSKVAESLGMTLDEFDRKIISGNASGIVTPLDQAVSIIRSLPASDLPRVLEEVADRMRTLDGKGSQQEPDYGRFRNLPCMIDR